VESRGYQIALITGHLELLVAAPAARGEGAGIEVGGGEGVGGVADWLVEGRGSPGDGSYVPRAGHRRNSVVWEMVQ